METYQIIAPYELLQQTPDSFRSSMFYGSLGAKSYLEADMGNEKGNYKTCPICYSIFYNFPCRNRIFCSVNCKVIDSKGKKKPKEFGEKISKIVKGRIISKKGRENISKGKLGNKNPVWKGDKVGLHALHNWIRRRKPKPKLCEDCGKVPPYDLANISGKYLRDINDFEWLCRKCHMTKDGRLKRLISARRGDKIA